MKLFTAGYSGHKAVDLAKIACALDAVVFDIRFRPASRVAEWNKGALTRLLGGRYQHVQAFGNKNYKNGGPVEIVDPKAGRALVAQETRPIILLCACRDYETCHRHTVADLLRAEGYAVEELDWSGQIASGFACSLGV